MTNLLKITSLISVATLLLTACGSGESPTAGEPANGKPRIVATTTMLADMVRQIVGDEAEVVGLMAPGVDPHTYELPAKAIGQLNSANLVVYNGMLLEGKMGEIIETLNSKGITTFAAASVIPEEKRFTAEGLGYGHGDPHLWGDAELWATIIDPCEEKIRSIFPNPDETSAVTKANAAAYKKELLELHEWIKTRVAKIPKEERLLVTSHDAFNYLGRAYDVDVVGVQGISTATDAGIADIVATVDLIKERKAKAIFVESSVSTATIKRISQDAGVKIGGELFSDSCGPLGETDTAEGETYDLGTYVGMMKHNINTFVNALAPVAQ